MVFEYETYQDFQNWQLSNGGTIENPLTLGPNVGYIKETKKYIIQIYSDGIPKNQLVDFSYFTGKSINDKYVADVLQYELQHNYVPTENESDPIYLKDKSEIFEKIASADEKADLATNTANTANTAINGFSFWKGTQAQYDALTSKDNNKIYLITEN